MSSSSRSSISPSHSSPIPTTPPRTTYGVWVEKSMYGKTYMGVERSTFVIAADGTLAKVMRKVKPDTHADDVLAALAATEA